VSDGKNGGWEMGDGMEVGYINVFWAGRTLASVSHTLAVFLPKCSWTQPMAVFFFSKNEIPDYHGVCSLLVFLDFHKRLTRQAHGRDALLLPETSKQKHICNMAASFLQNRNVAYDGVSSWSSLVDLPKPKTE